VQVERIREVTEAYRRTTMGTLRVAFLSALVLETVATIGTALVAVGVGLRLVGGSLDLRSRLAVLILAPEIYLPLRQVGSMFHASVDGIAAAQRGFALLGTQVAPASGAAAAVPDPARDPIRLEGVTLGGVDLRRLDQDEVRRVIGLASEDAHLFATTVRHNLLLARPAATDEELRAAARQASILGWIESLPRGWDTPVGELGAQVSGGQRRRLALARALLAGFPVLVVDEPTAHLDPATAAAVTRELLAATRGRTLLLITHRLEGLEEVDHIAVMERGRIVEQGSHGELMGRAGAYRAMRQRAGQALAARPVRPVGLAAEG
jgi:ABC-type transport system involved in cytochrome bd biosynthesis fused ATPase/permease subunit